MTMFYSELYSRYYRVFHAKPPQEDIEIMESFCNAEEISPRDPVITLLMFLLSARQHLAVQQAMAAKEVVEAQREVAKAVNNLALAVQASRNDTREASRHSVRFARFVGVLFLAVCVIVAVRL